ncbi:MAG TPA: hypothetical protein VK207_07375 [Bacteroidales bacterium]|jgi:hypothetical protein|nr:hypothetical protein [Bacteroidales bacterium]
MKNKEKKVKYTQYHGQDKDLIRNYTIEMQIVAKSPKVYYSRDGLLKSIK